MYSFKNSGIDGAGFQNVIALDPFNANNLLIGCDVAGFHFSRARGGAWRTGNRGLSTLPLCKVATILYSPTVQNKIYAGVGNKGANGGLVVSIDGGMSWEVRSTSPQFSGGNTGSGYPLPSPHPRSTGNLLALDTANDHLYAGTFSQGIMRSDDDGATWPVTISLGVGTKYVRSIALDPADPSRLFVATAGDRAWLITNAGSGSPSATQLTNAPTIVEEFKFIGSNLYAVCGASGIFHVSSNGATWTALNNGVDLVTSKWMSIDGYQNGGQDVLVVGCAFPEKFPQGGGIAYAKALLRSTDSGATWTAISFDSSGVHTNYIGANGSPGTKQWWLPQTNTSILIHRNTFIASSIVIDPANTQRIYVAGRSGAWRTDDGGTNWYPLVQGLAATINRAVAADPNDPAKLWVGNTDWVVVKSQNRGTDVIQDKPGPNTGYDLMVDSVSSRIYAAFGHRDLNQNGKIYSKLYNANKWDDELIDAPPGVPILSDNFDRTVSGGWGTPDYGPSYTVSQAAQFSVDTISGNIALDGANRNYRADAVLGLQDVTAFCDVSWSALAAGGASQAELTIRQTASNTFYGCRLRNTTDGNVTLVIRKNVSGTSTTIANKVALIEGYIPGERIYLRFNCAGVSPTVLQARAWRDGEEEPENWDLDTTDSEVSLQTSGNVSVRGISDASYTSNATYSYYAAEFMQLGTSATGGKRPIGIAVGRDGSNELVILAAVEASGIWRKHSGTWTQVGSPYMNGTQSTKAAPFSWVAGSPYVFLYDRSTGIYRSSDYGSTWSLIWAQTSDSEMTGFVAAVPGDTSTLWVSSQNVLYRLDNADTGTSVGSGITSTQITAVPRTGSVAVSHDGSTVFCVSKIGTGLALGEDAGLFVSQDSGANWQDVSDATYRGVAAYPFKLTTGPDGTLYVALNGNGVLVGSQLSSRLKAWNGTSWQQYPFRRWNGTDWETIPARQWDGSQWKQ